MLFLPIVATGLAALLPLASADTIKCNQDSHCPEQYPCCSQYGECGTGAYCLGGCDPRSSFSLDSCVPAPICQNKVYDFDNLDGIAPNTRYLGDADSADWVSSGQPLSASGNLILTMAPKTVGTLLANNHYVWYGKISARLRSSRGAGVVTAFILMSDVKDEIDFEFVGADLKNAETNYYFQGIPIWTNQISASLSDTFANYHDYEIDWKPDHITWSIDGQEVRTLKKSDTYNETTKQYDFPQSPSRVQLSLWPAGLESAAKGTIEWGGGLVDWESDDVKKNGYYYALVDKVSIECYDPPSSAGSGSKSYVYKNYDGTEDSVELSDKVTVLKSFYADGENPDRDPNAPKPKTTTTEEPKSTKTTATAEDKKTSSATETKTTASSTPTMNTDNLIPGLQGGGSPMRPNLGHDDDDKKDDKKEDDDDDDDKDDKDDKKGNDNSSSNSSSSSNSGSVTPSHPRPEDPDNTGFNQGVEASKNSASGVSGSVFAAVVCIAALVVAL